MTIDRQKAREFMTAVNKAVEQIGKDMGLAARVDGGASFTSASVRVKLIAETTDEKDVPKSLRNNWDWYATRHGFAQDDLGKSFWIDGTSYTINAWNPRAPKRPLLAVRDHDGRTFCFQPATVRSALIRSRNPGLAVA